MFRKLVTGSGSCPYSTDFHTEFKISEERQVLGSLDISRDNFKRDALMNSRHNICYE